MWVSLSVYRWLAGLAAYVQVHSLLCLTSLNGEDSSSQISRQESGDSLSAAARPYHCTPGFAFPNGVSDPSCELTARYANMRICIC